MLHSRGIRVGNRERQEGRERDYLFQDTLLEQTGLLGSHDKVVCLIFVVHYVLQLYAMLLCQGVEEVLPVDIGHSTYLWNRVLLLRVVIHKVCRNGESQLGSELLQPEPRETVLLPVCRQYSIKFIRVDRAGGGLGGHLPPSVGVRWFDEASEGDADVHPHSQEETHLQEDSLENTDAWVMGEVGETMKTGKGRKLWLMIGQEVGRHTYRASLPADYRKASVL